jgi:serine/threonine protein kinase
VTPSHSCPNCGNPIAPGSHFCTACGMDVYSEQALVTTARVPLSTGLTQSVEVEMLAALRHTILGEYDIIGELGRGGMAIVYLAHDIGLDRKVAIKVMAPTLLAVQGMAERFKREARTSAGLSHPHIIPIYTVRQTDWLLFFVMKYVQGRALDLIIEEEGALPIRMVRGILDHVGSALGYAHRHGVIHRDIKPANIMIDEEGFAVVTDFGIAKPTDSDELTATGMLVGTPRYMSPEQCSGKALTGASDQYSLGAVAYEMLTGIQPFRGDSLMEVMKKHLFDAPAPVEQLRLDCPPELAQAVMRMLAKEPQNRWPTVEQAMAFAGAESLSPEDPVRSQMVDLAKAGKQEKETSRWSTPRSPMPQVSEEVAAAKAVSTPVGDTPSAAPQARKPVPPRPKPRRAIFKSLLVACAIVMIVAGGWLVYDVVAPMIFRPEPSMSTLEQESSVLPQDSVATPVSPPAGDAQQADELAEPEPPQTGRILVEGLPNNGTVYIDDQRTEGTNIEFASGVHVIRMEAPGYEPMEETVDLAAGASLDMQFAGRRVPTEPRQRPVAQPRPPQLGFLGLAISNTQAAVRVDEIDFGIMRRGVIPLEANVQHRLRLERQGYLPFDTVLVVTAGDTVRLARSLVRRPQ